MCKLNTNASATPPEMQHAILAGLAGKVNGMDVTDVLMKNKSTKKTGWYQTDSSYDSEIDSLLETLISNRLKITTEQNSVDIARLMQTRIFDLVVMKMHKWLDDHFKDGEKLTLYLTLLLQLLQLRPYHTGQGFVFVSVTGQFENSDGSRYTYKEEQRFEVPSSETTKYISDAVKMEMSVSMTNPECVSADAHVSRITIADILEKITNLPLLSDTHKTLCLRILPLLIQNTHQQMPKVG